jgi:hypothetical protein
MMIMMIVMVTILKVINNPLSLTPSNSPFTNHPVRSEVFTVVTIKNAVFSDVARCRSCVNRDVGGSYRLHLQGRNIREQGASVRRWLQT